jgi:hypothetical protein
MEKIAAGESFDQDAISLATAVAAHREILKESNTAALHETSYLVPSTLRRVRLRRVLPALTAERAQVAKPRHLL